MLYMYRLVRYMYISFDVYDCGKCTNTAALDLLILNAGPYPLHKSGTLKSRLGVRDLSVTWGHGRVKCRPYPLHKSGTLKSDKPFQIWFRGQEDLYPCLSVGRPAIALRSQRAECMGAMEPAVVTGRS